MIAVKLTEDQRRYLLDLLDLDRVALDESDASAAFDLNVAAKRALEGEELPMDQLRHLDSNGRPTCGRDPEGSLLVDDVTHVTCRRCVGRYQSIRGLLNRARDASARQGVVADAAKAKAVEAIRFLERELVAALGGRPLRGLANLTTWQSPFYGAHLRRKDPLCPLEKGESALCVNARGQFCVVSFISYGPGEYEIKIRKAEDEDFSAEDLVRVGRALKFVLRQHLKKTEESRERFDRILSVAERVMAEAK